MGRDFSARLTVESAHGDLVHILIFIAHLQMYIASRIK